MKTHIPVPSDKIVACQCPSCVPQPACTYTPEYMQECLARWYVNATAAQREEYLGALRRQHGWQGRMDQLNAIAERLGLVHSLSHSCRTVYSSDRDTLL